MNNPDIPPDYELTTPHTRVTPQMIHDLGLLASEDIELHPSEPRPRTVDCSLGVFDLRMPSQVRYLN